MSKTWGNSLQLGKYTLKNRLMFAAMTRMRCDPANGIPNDMVIQYYGQRAGAGLSITEAASWSRRGCSNPGAGDIFTKQQALGWKKVTDEVHKKNGKIFVQLFHAGRATHSKFTGGQQPLGPSAIPIKYEKIFLLGKADYTTPKQMSLQQIQVTKKEFEESVKLAKFAGFDGVQFHSANGYLIDQFIRSNSNKRTDAYGGSAENRCRFVLELTDIVLKHFQPYQIGLKLCPTGRYNDMFDQKPIQTYSYLLQKLNERKIGFVELFQSIQLEWGSDSMDHYPTAKSQIAQVCKTLRPYYQGLLYANHLSPENGLKLIQEGHCDGVSFGRPYINNPDLDQRLIHGFPIDTNYDYSTFYGLLLEEKAKGYIDYPRYNPVGKL